MNGLQPMRDLQSLRGLRSSKKYVTLIRLVGLRFGLSGSQSSSVSKESSYFNEFEKIDMTRPSTHDTTSISMPTTHYTQFHVVCVFSTPASPYGKNLRTISKDPSTYSYPPNMGIKPRDLRTLTMYLPYKGRSYVHRISVKLIPLYKHQASSSSRYVQFPKSHTFKVIRDSSVTDLIFGEFLTNTPPVIPIRSSHFILQIPPITALVMINSMTILCIITQLQIMYNLFFSIPKN